MVLGQLVESCLPNWSHQQQHPELFVILSWMSFEVGVMECCFSQLTVVTPANVITSTTVINHKRNTFSTNVIAAACYKLNTWFPTNNNYYVCEDVKFFIVLSVVVVIVIVIMICYLISVYIVAIVYCYWNSIFEGLAKLNVLASWFLTVLCHSWLFTVVFSLWYKLLSYIVSDLNKCIK